MIRFLAPRILVVVALVMGVRVVAHAVAAYADAHGWEIAVLTVGGMMAGPMGGLVGLLFAIAPLILVASLVIGTAGILALLIMAAWRSARRFI